MSIFRFKQFSVLNERSALKVGTDAVLLGAAMTLPGSKPFPRPIPGDDPAVPKIPSDDPAVPKIHGNDLAVRENSSGSAAFAKSFCDSDVGVPEAGCGQLRCLDIGTGTGVIALMVAQRCPEALILGIDIDRPSCEEAAANFAASPWSDRLKAACMSLEELDWNLPPAGAVRQGRDFAGWSPVQTSPAEGQFDLIFSNPPFYDTSLLNPDSREAAARHSCSLSWRDILSFAARRLSPQGTLSLILPAECEFDLLRRAAGCGLTPFRIVRIRTTRSKPVRRIIVELFRNPPGNSATSPAASPSSSGSRSAAYRHPAADSDIQGKAAGNTASGQVVSGPDFPDRNALQGAVPLNGAAPIGVEEEELILQDGTRRSEEFARLTEEFYL